MSTTELASLVNRLETVTTRLESVASGQGSKGGATDETPEFVEQYDVFRNGALAKFLDLCNKVGGDVQKQAALFNQGFIAQKDFLVIVGRSKVPSPDMLQKLLGPTSQAIEAVQTFREKNRSSKDFNLLSALSEAVPVLGWVTVAPKPANYIKEITDSAEFYINRVIKDFKDSDPLRADWAKDLKKLSLALQEYVKNYATTGISWNVNGVEAKLGPPAATAAAPPPPPAGGAPPPPPPGPPPPPVNTAPGDGDDDSEARSKLFSDLNKGADITKGLKKVTDDMKTHKNPAIRQGPKPFAKPAVAPKFKAFGATNTSVPPQAAKKPPVLELQGKKWLIEYQENNQSIVLDDVNLKQTVYAYKCVGSVIQVKGKVNSIILDGCKKTGVVFENVVGTVEFINCQSMKCQVTGKVPSVLIDKTDGFQLYLNKDSMDTVITSAKSSEMNICLQEEDGDMKEFPVPEQFKTVWNGKKFDTTEMDMNV